MFNVTFTPDTDINNMEIDDLREFLQEIGIEDTDLGIYTDSIYKYISQVMGDSRNRHDIPEDTRVHIEKLGTIADELTKLIDVIFSDSDIEG